MASGRKTGGRAKGTPNKKTEELAQRLADIGCDPVEGMATIAMDEANPPELRGRMYAELAQYLYPKRFSAVALGLCPMICATTPFGISIHSASVLKERRNPLRLTLLIPAIKQTFVF